MKGYKKQLLQLFIPIMLSNLINQVQMLIDRIFLGRTDVLYMSAVGNATAPVWMTMSVVFTLSMGASILISQSIGAEKKNLAKDYAASLITFHNIIPVVMFFFWIIFAPFVYSALGVSENVMPYCVTYTRFYAPVFLILGLEASFGVVLQTSANTKPLIFFGIIRSGLNIILDYCLIFGHFGFPKMGIAGAAIATTIAEYAGLIYGLFYTIKISSSKRPLISMPEIKKLLHPSFTLYFSSLKLGINAALEDFIWNIGNIVIMRILNSINETAAGIYSIVFSVEILAVVIVGAIGNATVTLTGRATGAKDLKSYRSIVRFAYSLGAITALFTLIITLIFPTQILSWFTKETAIIASSAIFLNLVAVNLFGKAANIIVGNGIRGFGDTKWMLLTQIFGTTFIICFSFIFVKVLHLGMIGVYFAVILDEILRALINTARFMRIKF